MSQNLGYDFRRNGLSMGWLDVEKRKHRAQQIREMLAEERAAMEEFEQYLRDKHRTQGGGRR